MAYFGQQPIQSTYLTNYFSGDGATTAFTLSRAPINAAAILVHISGVKQHASTYGVNGTALTFSAAPPTGTNNIEVLHLGIAPDTVTNPSYRTVTEFTATAGQTTFATASYVVGYIDVYRNGVKLGTADFTATDGVNVVLVNGCAAGDLVRTESLIITSIQNAIQAVAGSVSSTYLAPGAAATNIGAGGVSQTMLAAGVAGNGPAFSAYPTSTQSFTANTTTKVLFDSELFDTNSCFASSRFTPNVPGYYLINAATVAIFGAGESSIMLYKNGVNFHNLMDMQGPYAYGLIGSVLVYMNGTTDYLEVYTFVQTTVTNIAGSGRTYFQGSLVRAA